jgi:hypothetical protein
MAITKCRGRGHRRNCRVAVAFSVAVLGIVPHWKPDSYALVDVGSVGALRCAVSGGADPPIVSRPQTRQASEIIPALISAFVAVTVGGVLLYARHPQGYWYALGSVAAGAAATGHAKALYGSGVQPGDTTASATSWIM